MSSAGEHIPRVRETAVRVTVLWDCVESVVCVVRPSTEIDRSIDGACARFKGIFLVTVVNVYSDVIAGFISDSIRTLRDRSVRDRDGRAFVHKT